MSGPEFVSDEDAALPAGETVAPAAAQSAEVGDGDAPRARRKRAREPAARRPLLVRLLSISPWGALKLTFLCILVGAVVMASQFDPRSPEIDVATVAGSLARDAWNAAVWSVRNFWRPALAGAGIVLPLWILWRLISLPFRR